MIELLTTYNVVIGVSILINFILIIGIRNLLIQNEQLEDRLINTIDTTRKKVEDALTNMQKLDNREAFEKDDEVGVTFDGIKKIVEELYNQI